MTHSFRLQFLVTRVLSLFLGGMLLVPILATAQTPAPAGIVTGCNFNTGRVGVECVNVVIANIIQIIFALSGAICLLNIIIAGYQIALGGVTGSGDTAGKERLKWALIGFFVAACSFGIINAALDAIA